MCVYQHVSGISLIVRKNPPLPIPMMDSKISVKDFIQIHFIRYDELAKELEYDVAGNSIKSWLIGRFRPPKDFEKVCRKNKKKLLEYSEWKLKEGVFELKKYQKRKPQGFWERKETHRYAFEWLCKKKKWDFPYGLYSLKKDDLFEHNIDGLSNYYKLSPIKMVTSIFPEFNWKIWKFQMTPMRYWEDDKNKIDYLKWLESEFKIKKPSEWYEVPIYIFEKNFGDTLIKTYFDGSVFNAVKFLYPKLDWDPTRFGQLVFKSQKKLFKTLKIIYPKRKIEYSYRKLDIRNPKTKSPLELDCYIPSLDLAFEYQGEQHYSENNFFHSGDKNSFKKQKFRDKIKKERCKDLNIRLIEVSKKNWDFSISGLKKLIKDYEK
jgi:hypothetical protein